MHEEKQHHEGGEHHAHHASHTKKSDAFTINKKTALILLSLVLLGVIVYGGLRCLVAATVNGVPISRYSVMHGLERASGKQFLDSLIIERVIADAARAKNIVVTDADMKAEIAKIEAGLVAQGATLDTLLSAQGMTRETLTKQLMLRKKLELLLGEKVAVTDAEIDKYISDAKIAIEEGKEQETRSAILEQLKGQKMQQEAPAYIEELRNGANVRFFGFYKPTAQPVAQ